jgi:hypothetical protein
MINWSLIAQVAGGGFGMTILNLLILALLAWAIGLGLQKWGRKK